VGARARRLGAVPAGLSRPAPSDAPTRRRPAPGALTWPPGGETLAYAHRQGSRRPEAVLTLVSVTRTYLEMRSPGDLVPFRIDDQDIRVEHAPECPPSFFRYLYAEVGRRYHWLDRLSWTREQIRARLAQPGVTLWVLSIKGAPAGYFELERHPDGSVEIAYFGLLPEFLGRGLGKHLLTAAVEAAWALGPNRVWLHTCTLDDPAALPNYKARGFEPYREIVYETEVPTS
jgi:GNAT superfamily N-acetyltransferase